MTRIWQGTATKPPVRKIKSPLGQERGIAIKLRGYRNDFSFLMGMIFSAGFIGLIIDEIFMPWDEEWTAFFLMIAVFLVYSFVSSWNFYYIKTAWRIKREAKIAVRSKDSRGNHKKRQLKERYIILIGFALGFLVYHEGPGSKDINERIKKLVLRKIGQSEHHIIEEIKHVVLDMPEDTFNDVGKSSIIIKEKLSFYGVEKIYDFEKEWSDRKLMSFWGALHRYL